MVPTADNASDHPLPDGRGSEGPPRVQPPEWVLVAVLFATGTILRCWQPSQMAVEHFDEGVYASNLYSPGAAYPYRHLYAPPLLPALLEWALILSGGVAGAVMIVNVIAGSAMIPSLWWVGRRWFGPLAGIAAAALCAFSQMHILYSRSALTDVFLCLWMLWGVYWAWRAILTGRLGAILLATVFGSLAWWTKYNGWLTLAVSGAGMSVWLLTSIVRGRADECHPQAACLRWLAIATLVVVGWVPYLNDLQSVGGYAVVSANHTQYAVGLSGWWSGLLRQWANLTSIESAGKSVGLCLMSVWIVGAATSTPAVRVRGIRTYLLVGVIAVLTATGPPHVPYSGHTIAAVVGLAVVGLVAEFCRFVKRKQNPRVALAFWMLSAWAVGLLVAVPLYTPYPRLALPLLVACWIAAGLAAQFLSDRLVKHGRMHSASGALQAPKWVAIASAIIVIAGLNPGLKNSPAFDNRSHLRTVATKINQRLPPGKSIVYVLGEPGLFFHLANQSRDADRLILPGGDFASLSPLDLPQSVTMYVVYGPHVMRAPGDPVAGISWAEANHAPIAEWNYKPSTLVLLNEYAPQTIETGDFQPFVIRLGRIER